MKRRSFLLSPLLLSLPAVAGQSFSGPAVQQFIAEMQKQHQFSANELSRFFSQLTVNPKVLKLINRPQTKPAYWRDYRARRVTPEAVLQGAKFAAQHRAVLSRAQQQSGVPAAILTAILGVETRYGNYLGDYQTAQSLATLAFAYPRRGAEFRRELSELLLYARQSGLNPLKLRGSFAGAFGWPQFLPSSARRFAVDFDGDGRVDLFSASDAIGSIGNFLRQHGWRRGIKISHRVHFSAAGDADSLILQTEKNAYQASLSLADFARAGATVDGDPDKNLRYLLVDLQNRFDSDYRAGSDNFYALTRYNKSFKYAATVTDLARAILSQQ